MSRIHILPEHEARKIAAGEVVERPASVIKELLENSLDAQTTEIRIDLKDGGKAFIQVSDMGIGMSPEDAHLCLEHHATSKIRSVADLSTLTTFGFRGEALSSIASVSNMHLITRRKEDAHAYKIELAAGKIVHEGPQAANPGTCIIVENLFFNVPARRAFLKQRDTEWRAIQQLVTAYALAFPHIGFTLTHDGTTTLNLAPCSTVFKRAQQLFGSEADGHLIEIPSATYREITISGYVSTAAFTRYDRRFIMSFVNQRWVKNHVLAKAILAGYQNSLPHGKYPHAAISLSLPTEHIDVNIHPRKEEILLLHPHLVTDVIESTITRLLNAQAVYPLQSVQTSYAVPQRATVPFSVPTLSTPLDSIKAPHVTPSWNQGEQQAHPTHAPVPTPFSVIPTSANTSNISHSAETQANVFQAAQQENIAPSYTLLGVFKATYLLVETEEGLLIIDQHAAHERIIFDQLQQQSSAQEYVELLFPELIQLNAEEYKSALHLIPHLEQLGIRAEPWGSSQLRISATTVLIKKIALTDIIMELITAYQEEKSISSTQLSQKLHYDMRALIACKAAVKAGDTLSNAEIHALIAAYLVTPHRMTCPHGRPTNWLVSSTYMEKMFKRA